MFTAVIKYVRALGYLVTFQINKAREVLDMNPGVMMATYDSVIEDKRRRIIAIQRRHWCHDCSRRIKEGKIEDADCGMGKLEKLKAGAAARAKQLVDRFAGDPTAVKNDPEYLKCQSAFKDFTSTLAEKQQRVTELETDLTDMMANIAGHKTQIQALLRDLEKLKEEKHDAVADVLSAKEERQIADMMTGLTSDRTSEELRELRELRSKATANARVSRELAGLDATRAEHEFLEYAQNVEADDEFDQLIGLSAKKESTAVQTETRIPEA